MLLRLQDLSKQIAGRVLFRDASLTLAAGDRVGLVGPNGAGKTTLLRVLLGEDAPDHGSVTRTRGVRISMLRQEIDPGQAHSVQEEAAGALHVLDRLEAEMRALEQEMAACGERGEVLAYSLSERYDRISTAFAHQGGFEREARVAAVLAGLGFDEQARQRPLNSMSGGWLMRVELAKLFLSSPDVLLLDEPTNHLDLPAIQWFEEAIDDFPGAVLVVSHDRTFLKRHVGRVVEMDGTGRFSVYSGNYDRYLEMRVEQREQLLAQKANQDREIAQMERFVERFRAKSTKARQAQSRIKALDRIERIEIAPEMKRGMRMRIPKPPRSGEIVMHLESVHKSYGEKTVYTGIDLEVRRGDRVALAGPNGAGKSTLLRIIADAVPIDQGSRRAGHQVEVAYYAQHQLEALHPANSVYEELANDARSEDFPRLRAHLGAFLFSGDDVDKKISVLSGGEKARVSLAKMLLRPANLLVMDEPTNHLDIVSRELLEDALRDFQGTLVFVSHDRSFINALANRIVEVDHGVLSEYLGNYDDYLRKKSQLHKKSAPPPTRASVRPEILQSAPAEPAVQRIAPPSKQERIAEREQRKVHERTQRRINRIEAEIQQRESGLEAIGWRLSDPQIASDADALSELQTERDALQAIIDDLYRDWERLADELAALTDALA